MSAIIMSYWDDTDYSSSDKNELQDSEIFGDSIHQTIINLIYICYFNAQRPMQKLPDSLMISLSDWKWNHPDLFRVEAWIYPVKFDKLVTRFKDNKIFSNNSIIDQEQIL